MHSKHHNHSYSHRIGSESSLPPHQRTMDEQPTARRTSSLDGSGKSTPASQPASQQPIRSGPFGHESGPKLAPTPTATRSPTIPTHFAAKTSPKAPGLYLFSDAFLRSAYSMMFYRRHVQFRSTGTFSISLPLHTT